MSQAIEIEDSFAEIRQRVLGTNINEQSLLATDYINVFNEVIMLLEMVPDMTECLDDIRDWQPVSYVEHFERSCFADKELAIMAYEHSPKEFREPFDQTVDLLNQLIARSIDRADRAVAAGDQMALCDMVLASVQDLHRLVDITGAIVNGRQTTLAQQDIDSLLAG